MDAGDRARALRQAVRHPRPWIAIPPNRPGDTVRFCGDRGCRGWAHPLHDGGDTFMAPLLPRARAFFFSAVALGAFVTVGGVAATGCATVDDDEAPLDGEHAAEDDDTGSAAEAVTAHAADGLEAVSPPEMLVATADLATRFGAKPARDAKLARIRRFRLDGVPSSVVVDVDTLASSVVSDAELARATRAGDAFASSPLVASLAETTRAAAANRALDRIPASASTGSAAEPFALTIDMCQSKRPWDQALFEWAVGLSDRLGKPVPVGIAMTGGWARAHPNELAQIVSWGDTRKLAITWINHSSTHPLNCIDEACRSAKFLTAGTVDFDAEVLGLEQALLARGLPPSVLFRFPGLVHDTNRLRQLARLSLLPLDANAWIAKGQPIAPRSVVLVHGNGNEAPGIRGFLGAVQDGARADALGRGRSALVSPLLVAPSPPVVR